MRSGAGKTLWANISVNFPRDLTQMVGELIERATVSLLKAA